MTTNVPPSITPSATSPNPPVTVVTPAMPPQLKRKYDDVVAFLGITVVAPTQGKKRRKRSPNAAAPPSDRLFAAAKFFVRGVDPFLDIGDALLYGPEHHWSTRAAPCPSNTIVIAPSELERQKICITAFDKLFIVIPDLLDVVKQLYLDIPTNAQPWEKFVKAMQKSAKSARTADTGGLKHCLNYTLPNPTQDVLIPPILKVEEKTDRGVRHPMLRYLILSWDDRLQLPPLVMRSLPLSTAGSREPDEVEGEAGSTEAPVPAPPNEFLARLVGGLVELKATHFPAFFWEEGSYDANNMQKGLLRGHLLVRVLRHIWTAPASALCGLDDGIPAVCNARIHGVYQVSPEMIGYAGVQARTMISTKEWKPRDGSYSYEQLFKSIVSLFKDADNPWVKETLAWLQSKVFGDAPDDFDVTAEPEIDASAAILAQRAALAAAAASTA